MFGYSSIELLQCTDRTPEKVFKDRYWGEAAGRFTYIEDPDGTLLEFIEPHKIPIMKK